MSTVYTPQDQFPGGTVTVPANGDSGDATVASGIWETCLDRALYVKNRLLEVLGGTRSLAALVVDGMGNQTVAPAAGDLVVSGNVTAGVAITATAGIISNASAAASALPTTTITRGYTILESPVLGWISTSGSGMAMARGLNIHAYSRIGQGSYLVTLNIGLASASYICPIVTLQSGAGLFLMPVVTTGLGGGKVTVNVGLYDNTLTGQDADFCLAVFGG